MAFPAPDAATSRLRLDPADAAFLADALGRLPGADRPNAPVTVDLNGRVAVRARGVGGRPGDRAGPVPLGLLRHAGPVPDQPRVPGPGGPAGVPRGRGRRPRLADRLPRRRPGVRLAAAATPTRRSGRPTTSSGSSPTPRPRPHRRPPEAAGGEADPRANAGPARTDRVGRGSRSTADRPAAARPRRRRPGGADRRGRGAAPGPGRGPLPGRPAGRRPEEAPASRDAWWRATLASLRQLRLQDVAG